MTIPSRTVYCACDPFKEVGENANGINSINMRIYTDAQTSPMLSGLFAGVSEDHSITSKRENPHWRAVRLQEVSTFQVSFNEGWTQGGDEMDGREECEDGESNRDIESRDRGDRIDKWTHDEPGRDRNE